MRTMGLAVIQNQTKRMKRRASRHALGIVLSDKGRLEQGINPPPPVARIGKQCARQIKKEWKGLHKGGNMLIC